MLQRLRLHLRRCIERGQYSRTTTTPADVLAHAGTLPIRIGGRSRRVLWANADTTCISGWELDRSPVPCVRTGRRAETDSRSLPFFRGSLLTTNNQRRTAGLVARPRLECLELPRKVAAMWRTGRTVLRERTTSDGEDKEAFIFMRNALNFAEKTSSRVKRELYPAV